MLIGMGSVSPTTNSFKFSIVKSNLVSNEIRIELVLPSLIFYIKSDCDMPLVLLHIIT